MLITYYICSRADLAEVSGSTARRWSILKQFVPTSETNYKLYGLIRATRLDRWGRTRLGLTVYNLLPVSCQTFDRIPLATASPRVRSSPLTVRSVVQTCS